MSSFASLVLFVRFSSAVFFLQVFPLWCNLWVCIFVVFSLSVSLLVCSPVLVLFVPDLHYVYFCVQQQSCAFILHYVL